MSSRWCALDTRPSFHQGTAQLQALNFFFIFPSLDHRDQTPPLPPLATTTPLKSPIVGLIFSVRGFSSDDVWLGNWLPAWSLAAIRMLPAHGRWGPKARSCMTLQSSRPLRGREEDGARIPAGFSRLHSHALEVRHRSASRCSVCVKGGTGTAQPLHALLESALYGAKGGEPLA